MQKPLRNKRRYVRVPLSGIVHWQSGTHQGHGEIVDVSAAGAGLRVPRADAEKLTGLLMLELPLAPEMSWRMTERGRIVARILEDHETTRVSVAFSDVGALERLPLAMAAD